MTLPNWFDEPVAGRYAEDSADMYAPEALDPCVAFLAALAPAGRALELGVGTGRVAVPLAAQGVEVHGIELSEAMAMRIPDRDIGVTLGDFATTQVPGTFDLVYLVFNTIGNVTTQDAQVATFANAARHLSSGGHFVIEVGIPDLQRVPFGERFRPFSVTPDHLGIDEYDVVSQGLVSHHYTRVDGEWQQASVPFRYVWSTELDLMARLAGMELVGRWADWDRSPFTELSTAHVSTWRKP